MRRAQIETPTIHRPTRRLAVWVWSVLVVLGALLMLAGLAIAGLGLLAEQRAVEQAAGRRPTSAKPIDQLPASAPLRATPRATPVPGESPPQGGSALPGRAGQVLPRFALQADPPELAPAPVGPGGRGAAAPAEASAGAPWVSPGASQAEQAVWIVIPRIRVDAPVVEVGIENGFYQVPAHEVGHHFDTPHPGNAGNSIFTGHVTHLVYGRVFARLSELQPGDLVYLYGENSETVWQIVERRVVPALDSSILYQWPDPTVTLYTCTGTYDWVAQDFSHRLAVIAVPYG